MITVANRDLSKTDRGAFFAGFALSECVVELDPQSLKYLRVVHRTALELSIPNCFGVGIGGFWLMREQIEQLRKLSEYYPPNEAPAVARTVEAYLKAQLRDLYPAVSNSQIIESTKQPLHENDKHESRICNMNN